jgi:hypothetical protein
VAPELRTPSSEANGYVIIVPPTNVATLLPVACANPADLEPFRGRRILLVGHFEPEVLTHKRGHFIQPEVLSNDILSLNVGYNLLLNYDNYGFIASTTAGSVSGQDEYSNQGYGNTDSHVHRSGERRVHVCAGRRRSVARLWMDKCANGGRPLSFG